MIVLKKEKEKEKEMIKIHLILLFNSFFFHISQLDSFNVTLVIQNAHDYYSDIREGIVNVIKSKSKSFYFIPIV